MAFNQLMGLATAEVLRFMPMNYLPAVVELGNQRFMLSHDTLSEVEKRTGKKFPYSLAGQTDKTSAFYGQLGFTKYTAIDVNTKMGAVAMDLNYVLRDTESFDEQFDLVTNNGTSEHIFNQQAVFTNIHNLCKVGGIMLHALPFLPWVNHGFYNYHPIVFRDLANANDYKWAFLWIGISFGEYDELPTGQDSWAWEQVNRTTPMWQKPLGRLEQFIYKKYIDSSNIMIVAAMIKQKEDDFVIPLQGRWINDIDDQNIKKKYQQEDTKAKSNS